MISLKIVLTGFLIYRIQRFTRIHRTWEICFLFLFGTLLIAMTFGNPAEVQTYAWLPTVVVTFMFLMAFEPELAQFANKILERLNPNSIAQKDSVLGEIARAASALATTKTGALIAFERRDSLLRFGDTGIEINADIKKELLTTLFTKDTPTHDGGVLIRKGRATHCGAVFPLSERKQIENGLGTRHRAALGLTEKTDAVCLVVSEEEGTISIAKRGELAYAVPAHEVELILKKLLSQNEGTQFYPLHYIKRYTAKLAEPNFVFFTKSFTERLYECAVALFWFTALFLLKTDRLLFQNNPEYLNLLLNEPWVFIPVTLLLVNFTLLVLNQNLRVDGVTKEVSKENRLLFLPLFGKKWTSRHLKAVTIKRESGAKNVVTLGLVTKKRKLFPLDRSTSVKTLTDYAKKIHDTLRLEFAA
ncbi:MAG: DNA integrity scanning protein DisA nucleotide-binding domain protein [Candidatus Omnitrophica bacterium]|nr:DNA integrity scanning protein DisA nucleotide-binding domain protein [Candidatus Omnitrophota bacterium]